MNILLNISFDFDYLPLFLIVAAAWAIPTFMSIIRLEKIPTVIIEIIIGFVIGKIFFHSFSEESLQILDFLALTGFLFLMFLGGLEIDVDQIVDSFPNKKINVSRFLKNPFLVGLVYFIFTLILSYSGAFFLSKIFDIQNIWYFSLIMVTTSVGIIIPVLKNRGDINTNFGQMLVLAAAIADIISIILFSFTAFVIKNGFNPKQLLILLLFVLFYFFYYLGNKYKQLSVFQKLSFKLSHAASQISVRGTIFLILIFVVLAQYIGEEIMILGAFLSGLLLSIFLHKSRSLLFIKLDGMGYGFFIPVFFIMVGARFDTTSLFEFDNTFLIFLAFLLILLFAVKIIPSFLWFKLFGFKRAISGGFLMASRLSLIIAASQIGLDLGVISPGVNSCFIIMAVVTCFISPVIYNNLNPKNIFSSQKTIIVGGSSTAVLLARRMKMHGKTAIIIENNKKRFNEIKSKGLNVILGDGKEKEVFGKIKLLKTNYVVVLTDSDEENIKTCKMLRKEFQHENIISKTLSLQIEQQFLQLDVEALDITRIIATTIENLIIRPTTYHTLVETFENFNIEEIQITNSEINGKYLKEIHFHRNISVILVKRDNDMNIPHGDTILKTGDILFVIGTNTALEETQIALS